MAQYSTKLPLTGSHDGLEMFTKTDQAMQSLQTHFAGPQPPADAEEWQIWRDTTNGRFRVFVNGDWEDLSLHLGVPTNQQCRFNYVSSTTCKLVPYNGNRLMWPDGRVGVIPSAGVSVVAPNDGTNAIYYAYAALGADGSITISMEKQSASPRATDAASSLAIQTGDASKILVGMAWTGLGAFYQTDAQNLVISWYNRLPWKQFLARFDTYTNSLAFVAAGPPMYSLLWGGAFVMSTRASAAKMFAYDSTNDGYVGITTVTGVTTPGHPFTPNVFGYGGRALDVSSRVAMPVQSHRLLINSGSGDIVTTTQVIIANAYVYNTTIEMDSEY